MDGSSVPAFLPVLVQQAHDIHEMMLTQEALPLLRTLGALLGPARGEDGGKPTENSSPRHCYQVLGSRWWGETRVVPEAGTDKEKTYLPRKNMSGVQDCVGI